MAYPVITSINGVKVTVEEPPASGPEHNLYEKALVFEQDGVSIQARLSYTDIKVLEVLLNL